VLKHLASGLTELQIHRIMPYSGSTIARSIRRIKSKLGAKTIPHAVVLGIKRGVLDIDSVT
jgi:DNA-binding CsgD family transcriptional regulator